MGGLSFLTIIELTFFRKKVRQMSSFAKITLLMTGSLIVLGFGILMLTDGISGNISPLEALFQSVTTRTAGFATFNQANLSPAGKTVSCVLMFINVRIVFNVVIVIPVIRVQIVSSAKAV